ncbi:MAG: peptidylprolyl isomerase [Actinobacteria bacterium]|nr:peptidylprolyl isomerase [Actinomycetota bacterium]
MQATRGAVVTLNYTLRNDEGELLDGMDQTIQYLHGYSNIIPGLENALEGVEPGNKQTVVIEPADAYGEFDPGAVVTLPCDSVPEGVELEPGMQVVGETPSGPVQLVVREVNEDSIVVDANHPLAGKTLHFEVEVTDVRTASDEELAQGYAEQS